MLPVFWGASEELPIRVFKDMVSSHMYRYILSPHACRIIDERLQSILEISHLLGSGTRELSPNYEYILLNQTS